MAQNIYDNPEFFAGYSQLPRQLQGLAGAPEWPAIRVLIPDLSGKHVVDLGCGFGWASRWMREQGASSVLGLDLSENMIRRAKADTSDPRIEFRIADIETVELPRESFDFAYSALTFHYIKDFERLAGMLHQTLVPGGSIVFTIEHPIFMAATEPCWITGQEGRKTWPVNQYSVEGERRTDWFTKGVLKYHRTIGTTLNSLIRAGFTIQALDEFCPSPEQIRANPELKDEIERPMMLLIAASR